MTQEEKQLLLKDLCARLPYGVKVNYIFDDGSSCPFTLSAKILNETIEKRFKPYLRPMSSMTNEEGKELEHIFSEIDAPCWVDTKYGCVNFAGDNDFIDTEIVEVYTDWLNAHHFDYRVLIGRGLALKAPEGMYKTE